MDPIAVTPALLRNQIPGFVIREGASLMARVASTGEAHAVIVIAGVPVTAKLPPEVQAGATLRLQVQEVTAERVTLRIASQPQPGRAGPAPQPAAANPAPPTPATYAPPAVQVGRALPAQPTLPAQTAQPGQPGQAAQSAPSTQTAPAGQTSQPGQQAQPGQTAQPGQAGQPGQAAQPGQPGQPALPGQAAPAGQPEPPAQPGQAPQAGQPAQPPQPGQTAQPPPQSRPAHEADQTAHAAQASQATEPAQPAQAQTAAPIAQNPIVPTLAAAMQLQPPKVEVEEPPARRRGADGEPADVVSLAFNSPTLGRLELRLELRGERLLAEVTTPAGRPHAIANGDSERLRARLEAAGLEATVKIRPRNEPLDLYA